MCKRRFFRLPAYGAPAQFHGVCAIRSKLNTEASDREHRFRPIVSVDQSDRLPTHGSRARACGERRARLVRAFGADCQRSLARRRLVRSSHRRPINACWRRRRAGDDSHGTSRTGGGPMRLLHHATVYKPLITCSTTNRCRSSRCRGSITRPLQSWKGSFWDDYLGTRNGGVKPIDDRGDAA